MADVAKIAGPGTGGPAQQQTVSSEDAASLAVVCGELTSAGSLSDLSLPEHEDQSLQDLIESELALRIALDREDDLHEDGRQLDDDVNTRFILAERNHSFQTFTGNDTFFFSTLEETPPSNGDADADAPESPCPPVLAAVFDPFTTTIVDAESSPSADSELVCLAHDVAVGDLVDFSQDDLPEDPPARDVVAPVGMLLDDDVAVPNSLECSVPANNPPLSPLTIPEIDVIPPDDDGCCSSDEEVVSSGQERCFEDEPEGEWTTVAEAVPPEVADDDLIEPEPRPQLTLFQAAEEHVDQVVGEALARVADISHEMASSSSVSGESDHEGSADPALKKTKKKRADGGDVTKTKKTKKTKKASDPEKENISVITNGYDHDDQLTHHSTNSNSLDDSSDRQVESECPSEGTAAEDDLSNVSVKELKTAFTKQVYPCRKADGKQLDEDLMYCGPIQSLKQTYCSEARKSSLSMNGMDKEIIATGISIKELRRSFGDLTKIGDEVDDAVIDDSLPDEEKTRSLGDLRPAASRCLEREQVQSAARGGNLDVVTGVSVKALKSSFSKFDQLTKKSVLHVRSVDAAKVQKQFNQTAAATPEQTSNCRSCGKQVFQMEQVKAERAVWHKNCFRCKECNKQLTVDIYSSHEGQLYCKPHFRELFKPKAVVDDDHELPRLRRHEMIIRENQPIELPPEVVRASDKPDLGLEELSALNVKSRFQVFEKATDEAAEVERSPSTVNVKRSPSILSKLARFQAKGMDIGVTDESLNGIPFEESSSSSEEEADEDSEGENDKGVVRSSRKHRERPVSFGKMEDIKCRWETGHAARKENLREERKHEISNIRSRLFMGHQGKMKEMYEQAVQDSERSAQKKGVDIKSERARSIKEKFERGEVLPDDDPDAVREDATKKAKEEDLSVVEAGISKKSRSLFLELDATAAKTQPLIPMSPVKTTPSFREDSRKLFTSRQVSEDVVRCSDTVEEVKVETEEVSTKFKFFEGYKPPEKQRKQFRITPPRDGQVKEESPECEIYRDPNVVRCEDRSEDDGELVARSHTTSKMLSLFRQLEENANKEELPDGPKPLKRFTPPPDYTHESESSEEESESEEDDDNEEEDERTNPNVVRASDKVEDEFLKQAQTAARAKVLRAKFERWEEKENKANATNVNNHVNGVDAEHDGEHQTSIDTTKSLRARFESLKHESQQPKEKMQRPKVNRFVEIQTNCAEFCSACEKKVYPLEKVETGGKIFHKQCFRCQQCNCILRMETYTLNGGKPYCLPHFKQLFIVKGNYDEGFGLDQHKRKWKTSSRSDDDILLNGIDGEASS